MSKLTWRGNILAQKLADDAYRKLKPKPKRKKVKAKKKRRVARRQQFDLLPRADYLTREFTQMVRNF